MPLFALLATPALAADLGWEGFYRARYLQYDSLSLSESNPLAEGTSAAVDHRFRIAPTWTVAQGVELHAQVDGLAYTRFGSTPDTAVNPVGGAATPLAFTDGQTPSGTMALTRGWADVHTPYGRLSFGRMPMQWGAGLLWNAGNDPLSEYGDSADRVAFTTRIGSVFVLGTADWVHEGYVNEPDDMLGLSAAVGYRTETSGVGFLNHVRSQSSNGWMAYTGDFWGYADLGPAQIQVEVAGTYGGGNLDSGANDVNLLAFGGMLDANWTNDALGLGLQGGFATGDSQPEDGDLRTFSFDRDHNVALMMFEEPMPTLRAAVPTEENGGRTTDAALLGEGVSNALYIRPRVGYRLGTFDADLAWIAAWMAKGPTATEGKRGYGNEVDLTLGWVPNPRVDVRGTLGVYAPGAYLSSFTDADLGSGFDQPAVGGRVVGTVKF
jgi:hypothetical protein